MSEFEVGQRVRAVGEYIPTPDGYIPAGAEGTVTAVLPLLPFPIYVSFDEHEVHGMYAEGASTKPDEIEAV